MLAPFREGAGMPQERLPMRKIRDVLRLHAAGHSKRRIAAGLTIGATSAGEYLLGPACAAIEPRQRRSRFEPAVPAGGHDAPPGADRPHPTNARAPKCEPRPRPRQPGPTTDARRPARPRSADHPKTILVGEVGPLYLPSWRIPFLGKSATAHRQGTPPSFSITKIQP